MKKHKSSEAFRRFSNKHKRGAQQKHRNEMKFQAEPTSNKIEHWGCHQSISIVLQLQLWVEIDVKSRILRLLEKCVTYYHSVQFWSLKHYREEITIFFEKEFHQNLKLIWVWLNFLSLFLYFLLAEDELSLLYGWDLIAKSRWVFFEYQLFLLWDFNFSSPTREWIVRWSRKRWNSPAVLSRPHRNSVVRLPLASTRKTFQNSSCFFLSNETRNVFPSFFRKEAKKKLFLLRCVIGSICRVRCSSSSSSRASSFKQSRGQSKREWDCRDGGNHLGCQINWVTEEWEAKK